MNMFGRDYEEIGSTDKGLILKSSGKIKILWGKKFIDMLDSDGNLNAGVKTLIKTVSSKSDIKKDGFYYFDGGIIVKVGEDLVELTSEGGDTYVSFLEKQETDAEQKYTALQNIGFIYKELNESNVYPTNGIVYIEKEQSLFIINNGMINKYTLSIPKPYTGQFIIKNESTNEGALIIEGEGISNSLKFDNLKIYSKGFDSIYEANKAHLFYAEGTKVLEINKQGIKINGIQSLDGGFKMYKDTDGKSVLDVDRIHVTEPLVEPQILTLVPTKSFGKENIIISTTKSIIKQYIVTLEGNDSDTPSEDTQEEIEIPVYTFKLKYKLNYSPENWIRTFLEVENNGTISIIPIRFIVDFVGNDNTVIVYDYPINNPLTEIKHISSEITFPGIIINYENISNSICYLTDYQLSDVNDSTKIASPLTLGEIYSKYKYNNSEEDGQSIGLISKLNIFYSAKFDKSNSESDKDNYPFYSEALNNTLNDKIFPTETQGSENNETSTDALALDSKFIIPTIDIVNKLVKNKLNELIGELREIDDMFRSLNDID